MLKELIRGVFIHYYHGFVGREFDGRMPFDPDHLSACMVEEMGVDRHMEETLRIVDQEELTDEEFVNFLMRRGYTGENARSLRRGEQDITVYTGPHLGGFNQRISIPEFIETVGAMSALCIFGRYWQEKWGFAD